MTESEPISIFDQIAHVAVSGMQSHDIVDLTTGKRVRLEELLPYPQVGNQYREIAKLPKGYLWTPRRRTLQALVILKPEFEPGSCVRIVHSSRYDPDTGEYVYMNAERGTADHLEMPPGGLARLEFHSDIGVFHLIKGSEKEQQQKGDVISSEEAERNFDVFFKSV